MTEHSGFFDTAHQRGPEMIDGIRMARELREMLNRRQAIDEGLEQAIAELRHWRNMEVGPLDDRIGAYTERLKGWHQAMANLGLAKRTQTLPGDVLVKIHKARERIEVTDGEAFVAWALEHAADPRVYGLTRTVVAEPVTKPDVKMLNAAANDSRLIRKDGPVLFDGEPVPGLKAVGGVDVSEVVATVGGPIVTKTGKVVTEDEIETWADEAENYTYTEGPDGTTLKVPREIDQ